MTAEKKLGATIVLSAVTAFAIGIAAMQYGSRVRGAEVAPVTAGDEWIRGSEVEKVSLISKHLRGFDVTMVEVGYRFTELYWAGQDENWEFAAYQLDKIRHVIDLGTERRPKRAASAGPFLTNTIPMMKEAIAKKDQRVFQERFKLLTVSCNSCHSMEKMPFVQVSPPDIRLSPVRYSKKK